MFLRPTTSRGNSEPDKPQMRRYRGRELEFELDTK